MDAMNPVVFTLQDALAIRTRYTGRSERKRGELAAEALGHIVNRIACRAGVEGLRLGKDEKAVRLLYDFVVEVQNGGFEQFLSNTTGATTESVKDALAALRADDARNLLSRVCEAVFGGGRVPKSKQVRNQALQRFGTAHPKKARFSAEDNRFRKEVVVGLLESVYQFIAANPRSFAYPDDATVAQYVHLDDIRQHYIREKLRERVATEAIPQRPEDQWDLLAQAIQAEDGNLLRGLVDKGLSLVLTDENGWGALHHVVYTGRFDLVVPLVEMGVDVNQATSKGWTPLFFFRKYCEPGEKSREAYKYLKSKGAVERPSIYEGSDF